MAVDNNFLVKKIQSRKKLFAAFSLATNEPLLVCDPVTFNDQIWLFEEEKLLQEFAKPYTEDKKIPLRGVMLQNHEFLKFFSTLFLLGANEVVYVGEGATSAVPLESIVRRPDYSKLDPQQVPISNPNLMLTGCYFMQEAARLVPQEEKENLAEKQEELFANMVKARYIIPVKLQEGPGTVQEKIKNKQYGFPILKDKKENIWQPTFTDVSEFEKFAKDKGLGAFGVPFAHLSKALTKEAKGFMLNPNGFKILMERALLEQLPKRFQ